MIWLTHRIAMAVHDGVSRVIHFNEVPDHCAMPSRNNAEYLDVAAMGVKGMHGLLRIKHVRTMKSQSGISALEIVRGKKSCCGC